MTGASSGPLVAFYGDDFTGSSENLAQYHRHGLRAILFLDAGRAAEIRRMAGEYDVIGIAGVSRSLGPDRMAEEIRPSLDLFRAIGGRFVQYKICSTFDSSPTVGSFGVPIAEARAIWPGCLIPVHAAMPEQGRFTAFGQHFARFGDRIFRLDRHPSMARHPSTPMDEADLGAHLARQTPEPMVHVTAPMLDGPAGDIGDALAGARTSGSIVIFDGMTSEHLDRTAKCLWDETRSGMVFTLGAQGLAHGLGRHLARELGRTPDPAPALDAAERMLVVSGSCAVQTNLQIEHAEAAGWAVVRLDVARLLDPESRLDSLDRVREAARRHFSQGRDVIILTARGPDDPALADVGAAMRRLGLSPDRSARGIGAAFASLARTLAGEFGLRRLVFSGGDTSSYAMRAIGAFALTIDRVDTLTNGHVCRLHADDPALDGLQVLLKGGQMGGPDLFTRAKSGG
jgi:uncharacterized protein YgbK (DUF1537 family)